MNTRPLIAPIERGEVAGFSVVKDVPSKLPAMVESGDADLGLLPAGYCVTRPGLALVPGVGIACRGPVRSILLLTRGDVRETRTIAATTSSMSSVRLLRVLLRDHFKQPAELAAADRPMDCLDRGDADGALLIGDPALQVEPGNYRTYDLGEEWFRFTGLPFVFALWAGPDAAIAERAAPGLAQAMRMGRSEIPRISEEAAEDLDLPAGLCEDYLSNYIIHDVGEAEMAGYDLFRQLTTKETP